MTNHESPSRPRRLAQRIAGFVGGLIGLAIWYVLWQSFTATTSPDKLAELASKPPFVMILTTSAIGCILLVGISASWLTSLATGLSRPRA
ncbi:hypothetical protein [Leifsonia sp. P73]|uniref:hypothetical protein n=1 Tax=Leifsonia sp. P73 TaxID=3423959 RepID=UPI003DA58CC4